MSGQLSVVIVSPDTVSNSINTTTLISIFKMEIKSKRRVQPGNFLRHSAALVPKLLPAHTTIRGTTGRSVGNYTCTCFKVDAKMAVNRVKLCPPGLPDKPHCQGTQCSPSKLWEAQSWKCASTSCKATPSLVLWVLSKTFTAAGKNCGVVYSELSSPHPNCCTRNNNLRSPEIQTIPGSPVVVLYYTKRVSALFNLTTSNLMAGIPQLA